MDRTNWRVFTSSRYRAFIVFYKDESKRQQQPRRIPVYDGESGRLHLETWNRADLRYAIAADGWMQETWPRFLADVCPDLIKDLPEGMTINERQTAENLEEMHGQDPEAPFRRFPGWENAGLGAGASRQDLAAFLEARDGELLAGLDGAAYALALGAQGGDELWRLDDAGGVAETYHLRPRAGALAFRPEGGSGEWSYRIGDPFPLLPTGERYGAMRFMDWLAGRNGVALPFHGVTARFRFGPAGAVEAARKDGGGIPGAWAWSRGDLVVSLEGVAQGVRYRWRDLAAHTGWKWQG